MARGLAGFFQGAAQVAVPMLLEQEKQAQIAARDARLATLQETAAEKARVAQAEENKKDRTARSEESGKDREHSESLAMAQIAAQQASDARRQEQGERGLDIQERSLGIQEEAAGREGQVQDINLKIANLSLDKQQQVQDLATTMLDDAATNEARQSALDKYRLLTDQEGKVIQVGGGQEWDENANAMRNLPTRLFDTTTRQFIEYSGGPQPTGEYKTPEEVRAAFRSKKISASQAEQLLSQFPEFNN